MGPIGGADTQYVHSQRRNTRDLRTCDHVWAGGEGVLKTTGREWSFMMLDGAAKREH